MNLIQKIWQLAGLFIVLSIISACGSNSEENNSDPQWVSYTGSTSQATINGSNAQALSLAPYSNLDQARNNDAAIEELQSILPGLLAGAFDECGGSYSQQFDTDSSGKLTFSDYCIITNNVDQIILDGTVYVSKSGQTQTMKMSSFNVSVNGTEYNVTGTFIREGNSFSMDFVGIDGKTYRIEDLVVQESNQVAGGVNIISGRFYHPDHGYVDMHSTSTIVSENCDGVVRPTSGKVIIEGANGSDASVEYQGCANYTVCTTQDTVCNTYPW